MAIKLEYAPVANYTKDTRCPHNNALVCDVKNCKRCGWNPEVAKKRLDKIMGKGKKKDGK